jgi:hypothetical protein
MKKLITLALASLTTLTLAGCGATDTVTLDTSCMTKGENNKTGLGGYWWTYVDRTGISTVTPNTGKVAPTDPASTELKPGIADGPGLGVEPDETGNKALHVTGSVTFAPAYSKSLGTDGIAKNYPGVDFKDTYVDANYGTLCAGGACGEVKYPAAGLGFGFKNGNASLGNDAVEKTGIAFRFKLGGTHGQTQTAGVPNPVAISLPLDLTDVPDPSFKDVYGTKYAPGFVDGTQLASGAKIPDPPANAPFCSFPNSLMADGTSTVGGSNKICFANLATIINPPPTTTWTSYCVKWDAFVAPSWAAGGLQAAGLSALSSAFASRIIKMQFDAYKPTEKETVAAPFDFWVDDVYLLDATNEAEHCTGATTIVSSAAP